MASMHIFIEDIVGSLFQMFRILKISCILRLKNGRGNHQVKMVLTSFILLNIRTSLCGMGTYFDISISLEEYLPLDVDFPLVPKVSLPNNLIVVKFVDNSFTFIVIIYMELTKISIITWIM